ncbi:UNVERIFIED_CONTAM: hypothetical protein FKN15_021129 [Acipenser sinensis]
MESLLNRWLWRHEYWLPPGVTWSDMVETESVHYPQPRDLLLTLPLSLVFIAVRSAFERKSSVCSQNNPLQTSQYWYYMTELAFYWSLLLRVSFDVKRKDFKEQVVHHIATIFLMGFSYCANYIRVGTLVLLVHDASDYLLESAKMFNYAGWRRVCDSLFFIFTAVFLVTRLVVFPSKVLYTTWYLSMESFQPFFGYYFFNALLLVLQLLHVFWAFLILRMVWKFVVQGRVERDERSDEEENHTEEEEEEEETCWERRKCAFDSKLPSLANNCVLNNLTNQRNGAPSRQPKAR